MSERPVQLDEDARAMLTAASVGAARANRPRWLVYLGAMLVVLALVYTLVQVFRRMSAETALKSQQGQYAAIMTEVNKLKAIEAEDEAMGGSVRATPDPRMLEKIKTAAREAGLSLSREEEGDAFGPSSANKNLKRRRYVFAMVNQPAEGVLAWMKTVTTSSQFPGVQINSLDMRPSEATADGKAGWKVEITFTRWERQQ